MKKDHPLKKWLKSSNVFSLLIFFIVFIVSFVAFVNSIIIGDLVKVGLAFSALVFYEIPFIVTIFFKISISKVLEISFYLFIFATLILGEVFAFYGPFPFWDIVLHFLSSFMIAGIGLSIGEIVSKNSSKKFILLFAFCLSVTICVFWECLEFGFDILARTDAQKDAHVNNISTITLQRDGGNQPVKVNDIVKTEIHLQNGETVTIDEGYLDIGITDTMKDIFVNIAGATTFCIYGSFYLKNHKKDALAGSFISTKSSSTK